MRQNSIDFNDSDAFLPLAARMRPKTLDEYVGQEHILAPGKALRRAIENGRCHSLILWGPPGTGKTTLAELIGRYADAAVESMSAVTDGVKEFRELIKKAEDNALIHQQKTVLFIDEIGAMAKNAQDRLLPYVENGTVILVGATTSNPSFELNGALLSRARVYILKKLQSANLLQLIEFAIKDSERGYGKHHINFPLELRELICEACDGDGRRALNYLELLVDMAPEVNEVKTIDRALIKELLGSRMPTYDKGGDVYFDLVSALHKSIRGSSPDGGLYWFARILTSGGDPLQVARRLLAIASEDIGNADPRALEIALNAWDTFTRVGPAEGERAIAQAIVYLACAPKSNAVYVAWNQARKLAASEPDYPVPLHLRNAPTKLMKSLGHGTEYRYAHNEPGAYAAGERYLPPELSQQKLYQPTERGLEKKIQDKLAYLADLDARASPKRYETD
ncbi:replication-associated recombination protein A [Photobacterium sanguinicancri]|uniref:replication-associated recombination protein A n=1 Tax=Photobacterium sanguinicancri TaxID=875932 RepID=UPI003D0D3AFE